MGVLIGSVDEDTDAYKKGIRPGDIVTHVQGEKVANVGEINKIKNRYNAGDTIKMTVYRKGDGSGAGKLWEYDILLGEVPQQ